MRISDWSSDVCSSDLRTLRPGHGDVRRPRGRGGAGARHLLSPAASLHLRSAEIDAAHRRARCLDAGGDPRPAAQPAEPAAGLHLPGRSEEHTSELQSLMRISYAVFCLKKKTHTNRIQQYTTTESKS